MQRAVEDEVDPPVRDAFALDPLPTPVWIIRSTVVCSSTPAWTVSSTSRRERMSTTTESIPRRCKRWESMSPPGPAPSVPSGPASSQWPGLRMRSTLAAVPTKSPPSPMTIESSFSTASISAHARTGFTGDAFDVISGSCAARFSTSILRMSSVQLLCRSFW